MKVTFQFRAAHGSRAFTLMELLLATVTAAIVLAAVNGVFYGALRLRNTATEAVAAAVPLEYALAVLKKDLAGLATPGGGTFSGDFSSTAVASGTFGAIATQVSPELRTATGPVNDVTEWAEMQKVAYLLAAPTNGAAGFDLVRATTRNLLSPYEEIPDYEWLMQGVEYVSFLYFDGENWIETWDSTTAETKLPKAIKVQIQMVNDASPRSLRSPVELVVPVMVEALTNSTATTQAGGSTP